MKNLIQSGIVFLLFFIHFNAFGQIQNTKSETYKLYGNCGMCKQTIEKAINQKNVVSANWNEDTKLLTVQYDATKTSKKDILKKVAEAGYDNEMYKAPTAEYEKLPKCCHYERPNLNKKN